MGDAVKRNSDAVKSEIKRVQAANTEIMENINKNFQEGKWYKLQFDGRFRKQLKEALSLSDEEVNEIVENVEEIIKKVINDIKEGKFDIISKKLNDKEIDQQNNYLYKDISFATEEDVLEIEDKAYINRSEDEI